MDKTKEYSLVLKLTKLMSSYLFLFITYLIFAIICILLVKETVKCIIIIIVVAIVLFAMLKYLKESEKDRMEIENAAKRVDKHKRKMQNKNDK
jgi:1,4-dihydroxy-2-naphthoate octaprenyltransferase